MAQQPAAEPSILARESASSFPCIPTCVGTLIHLTILEKESSSWSRSFHRLTLLRGPLEPTILEKESSSWNRSFHRLTLLRGPLEPTILEKESSSWNRSFHGGIFALRAHCALLFDYVPPEEPPSTPLGNALRIR